MDTRKYNFTSKNGYKEQDIDIISNSFKLKLAVQDIVAKNRLSIKKICKKLNIRYDVIMDWAVPMSIRRRSASSITHGEIISFCEYIGVDVRITIVINNKKFLNEDRI